MKRLTKQHDKTFDKISHIPPHFRPFPGGERDRDEKEGWIFPLHDHELSEKPKKQLESEPTKKSKFEILLWYFPFQFSVILSVGAFKKNLFVRTAPLFLLLAQKSQIWKNFGLRDEGISINFPCSLPKKIKIPKTFPSPFQKVEENIYRGKIRVFDFRGKRVKSGFYNTYKFKIFPRTRRTASSHLRNSPFQQESKGERD